MSSQTTKTSSIPMRKTTASVPTAGHTTVKTLDASTYQPGGNAHQQQKAILSTEGPALIMAGPGSGKTFTLIERFIEGALVSFVAVT